MRGLLAVAGLLLIAPASSQEPPPAASGSGEPEGQFFESIDVNLVNVDVYVTDKKGNRVTGLTRDDFEVYEDGRPVSITNFYAVEDGVPATEPAPAPGAAPQAAPEPELPKAYQQQTLVPEDQRLHLVVYIDNWNIRPFNRNRVFIGLRNFLRTQLSPSDRVMLMTFDREPHVRYPFTSDTTAVAAQLFDIEKLSANGVRLESERREILQAITDSESANTIYPRVRSYTESLFNDLSFSINSIRDLVDNLAGLPGRKAILYVSDGLELVPGEDVFNALHEKYPDSTSLILESHQWDLSRRFQELVSSANANRISFYTLDAAGLRVSTSASAVDMQRNASAFVDSIYWGNLQGSIQLMADRTGGIAIVNTNNPTDRLGVVAADFKNYYSLGYSPAHAGDGRYHNIEVKTKRKDLQVRNRDGYRDKSVEARMSDGVMAALTFDVDDNPLGVKIDYGKEIPSDGGHFTVPVTIRIPIGKLVLLPQGDKRVARARLYIAAMDDKGGTSDVQQVRLPIEIPESQVEEASQKYWRYDVPMLMRRGSQKLAVGLRDELGQVSSFAVRALTVGG